MLGSFACATLQVSSSHVFFLGVEGFKTVEHPKEKKLLLHCCIDTFHVISECFDYMGMMTPYMNNFQKTIETILNQLVVKIREKFNDIISGKFAGKILEIRPYNACLEIADSIQDHQQNQSVPLLLF